MWIVLLNFSRSSKLIDHFQMSWNFQQYPKIMWTSYRDLLRRQRYLKSLRILMAIKRLGQMVFPRHFFKLARRFSNQILWLYFAIFMLKVIPKKNYNSRSQGLSPYWSCCLGGGGVCYKIIAKFLATPLHSHGRYHFSFISFQLQENSQTCTYY